MGGAGNVLVCPVYFEKIAEINLAWHHPLDRASVCAIDSKDSTECSAMDSSFQEYIIANRVDSGLLQLTWQLVAKVQDH